jgi:hypothetical protein
MRSVFQSKTYTSKLSPSDTLPCCGAWEGARLNQKKHIYQRDPNTQTHGEGPGMPG